MKLQGMGVVFTLILLPLILVLSYYIQIQVDTIILQKNYDSKLLDATYDALAAFELNTANEDLSTVSDSLRTIIDASSNVFMSSLATNLGMSNASKSYVEPFIPALLYTLYDGYYIYSPTKVPTTLVDKDGNALTVGDVGVREVTGNPHIYTFEGLSSDYEKYYNYKKNYTDRECMTKEEAEEYELGHSVYYDSVKTQPEDFGQLLFETNTANQYTTRIQDAKLKVDNVLKSYIPYSARYKNDSGKFDITVVYTLDNYITIDGVIDGVYYTKSGYLIPTKDRDNKDYVTISIYDPATGTNNSNFLDKYNQNDAEKTIEKEINESYGEITVTFRGDSNESFTAGGLYESSGDPITKKDIEDDIYALTNQLDIAKRNIVIINKLETIPDEYKVEYQKLITTVIDVFKNKLHYSVKPGAEFPVVDTNVFDPNTDDKDTMRSVFNTIATECEKQINLRQYEDDKISAAIYYAKAKIFSKWVDENLGNGGGSNCQVKASDIVEISNNDLYKINIDDYKNIADNNEKFMYEFDGDNYMIFSSESLKGTGEQEYKRDLNSGEQAQRSNHQIHDILHNSVIEIDEDSKFYSHKLNVIRNSIQYNLNLTLSVYNLNPIYRFNYQMPVMSSSQWEQILSRVSLVSFMQGFACGIKTYSNYMIVSSSNNEISVDDDDIYYVPKKDFNNELTEYHKVNCKELAEFDNSTTVPAEEKQYIAFSSKDVKYDKMYNKMNEQLPYTYDHKNYACYKCINDKNYELLDIFKNSYTAEYRNLRIAYYIGLGKVRNNTYKMNSVLNSQGYEILYDISVPGCDPSKLSLKPMKEIKEIEIVMGPVSAAEEVVPCKIKVSGGYVNDTTYNIVMNTTESTKQVYSVQVDPHISTVPEGQNISKSSLSFEVLSSSSVNVDDLHNAIRYVRVIYK